MEAAAWPKKPRAKMRCESFDLVLFFLSSPERKRVFLPPPYFLSPVFVGSWISVIVSVVDVADVTTPVAPLERTTTLEAGLDASKFVPVTRSVLLLIKRVVVVSATVGGTVGGGGGGGGGGGPGGDGPGGDGPGGP